MHEIVSIENMESFVAEVRQSGKQQIVFTNGCFDILHRGHVDLLEKAKALGDYLILGLNSDKSVSRLKGSDRPLVSQEDRAFILSRLESVDAVCIFEEDTPLNLIAEIRPDILVKGGDYTVDTIVGHEMVLENGGHVLTIPLVPNNSTTKLFNKLKKLSS